MQPRSGVRRTWGRLAVDAIRWPICLNVGLRDELERTPRRWIWLNICLGLLAIVATYLAFEDSRSQGFHRVVPDAVEVLAQTVGIDLSHRFHGTTGYVGRMEVLETLFQGGFTGRQNYLDKLGIQYPANVDMPDRIDRSIQDALALKGLPPDASFANRKLYAPDANDPGLVDYVSWSFNIFGFEVQSLFYFYFLILSVSVGLFLICYRNDTLPLVLLSAVVVSLLTLLHSQLFTYVGLRTVYNQRFLGTLCVIPYLHLLFALLIYRRPTPVRVVATVLQTALFTFVMFTRSSAIWMILSFAVVIGLNVAFQFGRPQWERKVMRGLGLAFSWPMILLAVGLAGSVAYKSAILHPIYSIGVFMPHHMIWHNAYMALGLHPDWQDMRGGKPIAERMTDNSAWWAAAAEGEERYGLAEPYLYNTEVGGLTGIKTELHEKLIRERFLRFAVQHPVSVLEVYLWYKPKLLLQESAWAFGAYRWEAGTLLCQIVFMAAAMLTWRRLGIPAHVRAGLSRALLVTAVVSLAPIMWTLPVRQYLGEQLLIWIAVLLYFASFALAKAWSAFARRPA